jgi:uncharacterized protein GlcG (DUF336 family)
MTNDNATSTYPTASITRDSALALIIAARHAARDLGIDVAIAVTDAGGHLKAFERADATPFLTAEVAVNKAWTAASFGLSTLVWNQVVGQSATAPLAHHPRVMAVGGGVPVIVDGRVVGAIGISGGNAQQDHDAAVAALRAVGLSAA